MLFDRLVTGQVVPMNPAAAVPRLNHVVNTGKALVLEAAKSTPAVILRDLRDRALLATLIYFFGRITALKMKVVAGFTALLPVNAPFSADQPRLARTTCRHPYPTASSSGTPPAIDAPGASMSAPASICALATSTSSLLAAQHSGVSA